MTTLVNVTRYSVEMNRPTRDATAKAWLLSTPGGLPHGGQNAKMLVKTDSDIDAIADLNGKP